MEPVNQIPALPPLPVPQAAATEQEQHASANPLVATVAATGTATVAALTHSFQPHHEQPDIDDAIYHDHPKDAVHALIGQRDPDVEMHALPAPKEPSESHMLFQTEIDPLNPDKPSSRKQQTRMDGIWYKHLDELKEYRTQNEHVSVPRKSGSLGEWCRTQRRYYKQYRKGESVPLTKERMKALEDLGFIWLPAEARKKRKLESTVLKSEGIGVGGAGTSIAVETHNSPTPENTHANCVTKDDEVKIQYRTPALENVHNTYDKSLSLLHRANERLCDAQNLLEKAMVEHKGALEEQKLAVKEMDRVCDNVLTTELNDNNDGEWNTYYQKLIKYKEDHGQILFAKTPNWTGDSKDLMGEKLDDVDGDDDDASNTNDDGIVNLAETNEENQISDTAMMDVDEAARNVSCKVEEANSTAEVRTTIDPDVAVAEAIVNDISTTVLDESGVTVDGDGKKKTLVEWVHSMRKAPKKSISEWRHRALDKTGFIWNQYDAIWTTKYRALVEFTETHGHARVPINDRALGVWVGTQRKQYRLRQKGKHSHMTDDRVTMLKHVGFVWEVNIWNERFEELKQFHVQYGHFLVPAVFAPKDISNKQLRPWISTQRSHYRFRLENKPSQLTDERIELLTNIGFPWKTKEDWLTRLNELGVYVQENGNLQVPKVYEKSPKLYRWVVCQRMEYQKHVEGQDSRLKLDQIRMLEKIGF